MSKRTAVLGAVALLGLVATVALGFGLPPTEEQEDYARLIAVHPPLAWTAYLAAGVTALASAAWLWRRDRRFDRVAGASGEIAVLFTALMLATGSIWGRPTWGVWWVWDARLTLSALMLALLLGYQALRRVTVDPERRATVSAVAALAAVVVVPLNHFAVTWWRTLHQDRSLAAINPSNNLDASYIRVMLLGFVAMTLTYVWLLLVRVRLEEVQETADAASLDIALRERRAEGGLGGLAEGGAT